MLPALDVGLSVGARSIADGKIDDLAIQAGRSEEQIEIAEGVEVAEVGAVGGDRFVVLLPKHLRPTERVLDGLAQEPAKRQAEELVAEEVEGAHGFFVHRVDQADTIDKSPLPETSAS